VPLVRFLSVTSNEWRKAVREAQWSFSPGLAMLGAKTAERLRGA
jgi:hypothetical protein